MTVTWTRTPTAHLGPHPSHKQTRPTMAAGDATHRLLPVHDRGENRGEKRERKGGHPNPRPPPPLLYSDMKNSEYTASAWGTCLPRVPHSREAGRLAEARWLSFSLHLLPLYPSLPLLLPHIRSSLSLPPSLPSTSEWRANRGGVRHRFCHLCGERLDLMV